MKGAGCAKVDLNWSGAYERWYYTVYSSFRNIAASRHGAPMTGRGHRWTGVGAAFLGAAAAHVLLLPELITAAIAASCTTMPDWIEFPMYRNGVCTGRLITHRTVTHWPPLWLAVIALGVHEGGLVGALALGAAIGSFTHILADCPNPMGIPWLWPTRRLKIGKKGLWKSGAHEPFLALVFATFGFVVWRLVDNVKIDIKPLF
jgi:membrane-bound metal-dependent hydrolase YbcI (DUF457 family)